MRPHIWVWAAVAALFVPACGGFGAGGRTPVTASIDLRGVAVEVHQAPG